MQARQLRTNAALLALAVVVSSVSASAQDDVEIEIEIDGEPGERDPGERDLATTTERVPPPPDVQPETAPFEARLAALEEALVAERRARQALEEALESTRGEVEPQPRTAPSAAPNVVIEENIAPPVGVRWYDHLRLSGYAQVQYEASQLSEDELFPGGEPRNLDRFVVRRGRLRLRGDWDWFGVALEIDASTVQGINVTVRRAQASVAYRVEGVAEPLVAATVGLTTTPFGRELRIGSDRFAFLERSTGSLALFPGPTDVGARIHGGLGAFRYDVGVFNGQPIDDESGALTRVPRRAPDVAMRLGAEGMLGEDVELAGGASFLYGTGFHPGTDSDKNHVEWVDLNENGLVDTGELVPLPARGATPSETFRRWGVNLDLHVAFRTKLGWTRVSGEATLASNLDRAFFVADPIAYGADIREVAGYVAVVQDLTRYAYVGYRYDYYDPDVDRLDNRRGALRGVDASIQTHSPIVGVRWPRVGLLLFQYDHVRDSLGRDARGVPVDLRNDRWSLRLQGVF